jgi:hypothetical protein
MRNLLMTLVLLATKQAGRVLEVAKFLAARLNPTEALRYE